ncbi:MAG: trypsin-like peptidase domain-containing protein [Planctomycetia bacterium]|nr:trypsin-like peptidase domain-containing protein [Planctomycetia bacterium]
MPRRSRVGRLAQVSAVLCAALLAAAPPPAHCAEPNAVQKLAETVGKGVVTIKCANGKMGSGFIVDARTVVTNFHVVAGAEKAEVVFHDKSHVDVTGFCAVSPGTDIVILNASIPAEKAVGALKIASNLPKPGESVYAFGAPLALSGSISDDIVSAVRTGKEIEAAAQLGYKADSLWIQTTAPISPGNSGGPIVDSAGEVLGLATFYDKRGQNINFATSSRQIASMLEAFNFLGKPDKKLSELPKPARGMAGSGNPSATLDFWNNWARLRTKARVASKTAPKAKDAKIALHDRIARGYAEFAAAVAAMTTKDVDASLLDIVSQDAAIHRRLGEAWSRSSAAIRSNNGRAMDVTAREIETLNRQLTESDNALTQVRFAMSKAHGIDFPSFVQGSEGKKAAGESKEKESEAARELKRAKLLIDAGNKDAAKQLLQRLKTQHTDTPEAEEADKLLKSL